jgi:hypothetical protein
MPVDVLSCLVIDHGSIKGCPIINTHVVQSATGHDEQLQNLLLAYLLFLKQEAPPALEDTKGLLYDLPSPAVAKVEASLVGGVRRGLLVRLDQELLARIRRIPQNIWLDMPALHLKNIFTTTKVLFYK